MKTVGAGLKLRYRGLARNRLWAEMTIAGYNLVRLAKRFRLILGVGLNQRP